MTQAGSSTTPDSIDVIAKRAKAIELRVEGKTLRQIAEQLGYSHPSGAQQAIIAGLDEMLQEPADQLREIWNARIDAAVSVVMGLIVNGGANALPAIDRLVTLSNRAARLNGLDAPIKVAPTDPEGNIPYVFDRTSALAALAPGPMADSQPPSADQGSGDGEAVG